VAKITGIDFKGRFCREFLKGNADYSRSNAGGSRGIWLYFLLKDGFVYEVLEHLSWEKSVRYFVIVEDGVQRCLFRKDVITCLKSHSA